MIELKLPNGEQVTAYPLTQAQRFMYFVFNGYGKNPAVLNIGTGCYWQGTFDAQTLREALEEAIARCDTIRLQFMPDKQFGLVQYLAPDAGIEIEEIDHSGMTEEESFVILKEWTKEGSANFFGRPLNIVRIMHLPGGYNGFYCKFHHLAFDGYAAKMFIADAMAIYVSKRTGAPYPKPMKPYLEAMAQELAYLDSDRRKADRAYWMQRFSTQSEPIFNDYLLDNRLTKQREESGDPDRRYLMLFEGEHPESRTLHYDVSAEDTQKVLDMCEKNGLSVPCVLMLGLRTALSAFNGNQEDVSIKFMINRRGTLLEKKSGGNRWHFYSLRTVVPPELSFADAVRAVEDEQNETFRHCAFDTLEMYHIKHMAMHIEHIEQTYDSLTFSYHAPQAVPFETEEIAKTAKGIWYNNDYSAQNLYLTVKHRLNDNGFEFIFEYRISENPLHDLEIFYDKMITAIMLGTENPDMTVGEILDKIAL